MRLWAPVVFLLLAACGGADDAALPTDEVTPIPVEVDGGIGDGAVSTSEASGQGIPAAIQGRWGLSAEDCDPARDDAKGLMTVNADTLRFYESVGTLGSASDRSSTRLRAVFAFTGEGMSWDRDMLLELQDNGKALVRQEFGAEASPNPFRYVRCP